VADFTLRYGPSTPSLPRRCGSAFARKQISSKLNMPTNRETGVGHYRLNAAHSWVNPQFLFLTDASSAHRLDMRELQRVETED
jgi:hypothetical protein